ncbi:unnamed protein product [Adineta ricciae]|uniref:G-protein coupled receptors family 1 profile domain-containing protein n=1 Tax=Adineta ricciae TaxID=249248 RepID=A0A816F9R5_ADIRI|nr:unnamed protein product [Adineta ricciae]CAF1657050.1 unnamed protein product [Adineta ricciae]
MDYITYLSSVQKNLFGYGGPIIIPIGTICCALSLLVFSKKALRKNPCAIYFRCVNLSNLIYIYSSVLMFVLAIGYNIDLSTHSLIGCRFIYYCTILFDTLGAFYLILASIDRFIVTSPNALTRQRSTYRLAFLCILIGTLFWMLFHIHMFIFINLQEVLPGYFVCYFQSELYRNLLFYYGTIIKGILMPLLLIVFGILTWKNLRIVHRNRVIPIRTGNTNLSGDREHSVLTKNRQFTLILLMEIIIYITFTLFLSLVGIYQQIAQSESETIVIYFIRNIALFISYLSLCANFFGNLFISKTFRSQVKHIFLCK